MNKMESEQNNWILLNLYFSWRKIMKLLVILTSFSFFILSEICWIKSSSTLAHSHNQWMGFSLLLGPCAWVKLGQERNASISWATWSSIKKFPSLLWALTTLLSRATIKEISKHINSGRKFLTALMNWVMMILQGNHFIISNSIVYILLHTQQLI